MPSLKNNCSFQRGQNQENELIILKYYQTQLNIYIEDKTFAKKNIALDNGSVEYIFEINNYEENNNNLLKKESLRELDSREPKLISQTKKMRGHKNKKKC